jgi:hypothetical protein
MVRSRKAVIVLLFVLLALTGCENKLARSEKPVAIKPSSTEAKGQDARFKLPPPTVAEVKAAVQRVFGDDVHMDEGAQPPFVAGDFNSDDSEDLMVWVKPNAARLADLNSELANWTIQEPRHAWLPPAGAHFVKLPPVSNERPQVKAGEPLLAVIHGYGPLGWTNNDARQAYVLVEVSGRAQNTVHLEHLPRQFLGGDVVRERLGTENGFLYWSGAQYVWQAGEPQAAVLTTKL